MSSTTPAHDPGRGPMARLIGATVIGTTMEFYDFFLYATATALVFGRAFFPSDEPLTGVLLAFATYAIGFLARPLGGIVFGHIGDRYGRRTALVWTLGLMGFATAAVGLLPTHDTIGIAAPLLLTALRLVQGFALGGEWGGAVILVAEYGSARRRGLWSSLPQMGGPLGNLLSTAVLTLFAAVMTDAAFLGWGWRVPFLLSVVLVFIGMYLRSRVEESPLFLAARQAAEQRLVKAPVARVIRGNARAVLLATAVRTGENTTFYTLTTFLIVYVTEFLGAERTLALTAITIGSVFQALAFAVTGALGDRIGRRATTLIGSLGTGVWVFVFFALVDRQSTAWAVLAVVVGLVLHGFMVGGSSAFYTEIFRTEVRYSGASVAYQLGSVLGGALAPMIAVSLLKAYDSSVPVSIYVLCMVLVTSVAITLAPETRGRDLGSAQLGARRVGA